jgi:tRNA pseudouridine38-40 synthase
VSVFQEGRSNLVQRYRMVISYRGTRYHGWQAQSVPATWKGEQLAIGEGLATVQQAVRQAILSVVGHPVDVVGSSRTDAGVHAKGQVAHFDTSATQIPVDGLRRAINARLPYDIAVREVRPVSQQFDAIKSTVNKRYQYLVWNTEDRPVFFSDLAWHRGKPLDVAAMQEAAGRFVGEHDFASFARPGHGRTHTLRCVQACQVSRRGHMVVIGVQGTGFLWHMVRIMVGTLVEVGLGRHRPDAIGDMIAARDRKAAGGTAPAHGLYLQWIRTQEESS